MTDYNDGKIYGWNGGECPVHPETIVRGWFRDGDFAEQTAKNTLWLHEYGNADLIAFQVIKEYKEPCKSLEIWVNHYKEDDRWGRFHFSKKDAENAGNGDLCTIHHFREVIEE